MRNHGGSKKKAKIGLPVILLTIVVVFLSGGIFYMTLKDLGTKKPLIDRQESVEVDRNQSTTESSEASVTASSSVPEESSSTSEVPQPQLELVSVTSAETNMTLKNASSPVQLEFTGVNGSCWIGILVNGEYVYQNTLSNGVVANAELPAATQDATIVLGASGNVKVKVAGLDMNFNPENTSSVKRNVYLNITYLAESGTTGETTVTP